MLYFHAAFTPLAGKRNSGCYVCLAALSFHYFPRVPASIIPYMLQSVISPTSKDIDAIGAPGYGGGTRRESTTQGFPGVPGPIVPDMLERIIGAAHKNIEPTYAP